jgi:hypothetical protein
VHGDHRRGQTVLGQGVFPRSTTLLRRDIFVYHHRSIAAGHPQAAKIAVRNNRRTGALAATVLDWWTSAHADETAVIALVTEAFEICEVPAWSFQHDGPAQ